MSTIDLATRNVADSFEDEDSSKAVSFSDSDNFDFLTNTLNKSNNPNYGRQASAKTAERNKITADTLRVLSSANYDDLDFKTRFNLLFNDPAMLKSSAVQDVLSKSCLRTIAWMVFLDCLPFDQSKWSERIAANRKEFETLRDEIFRDPRKSQEVDDHPLSYDAKSDWNRYFERNMLRDLITQDVIRINQNTPFFSLQSTRNKIIDLLIVYVESSKNEYKQGMHEILACILFIVNEEYTWLNEKSKCTTDLIKFIADKNYMEHDTFTLFQAVMSVMYEWFSSGNCINNLIANKNQEKKLGLTMNPKLFQEEEEPIESPIVIKVNQIFNEVLRKNDIELFRHFNAIDLSTHLFGIRWLRLLFLRELDFPSVLILWDAIFALDKNRFGLVDYIFISILIHLKDTLLANDISGCLQILMQQQLHLDSHRVLRKALLYFIPSANSDTNDFENTYEIINSLRDSIPQYESVMKQPRNSIPKQTQNQAHNSLANNNAQRDPIRNSIDKTSSQSQSQSQSQSSKKSMSAQKEINSQKSHSAQNRAKKHLVQYTQMEQMRSLYSSENEFRRKSSALDSDQDFMEIYKRQHVDLKADFFAQEIIKKINQLESEIKHLKNQNQEVIKSSVSKLNESIEFFERSKNYSHDDNILKGLIVLKQLRESLNCGRKKDVKKSLTNSFSTTNSSIVDRESKRPRSRSN